MPIGQPYGWTHEMMGWGMWMVPWGWILVIILLAILIYATVGRGKSNARAPSGTSYNEQEQNRETPLEILKKRYARGEISREDFEQIKKDLSI